MTGGLKRFILWDYPRASWQYDVMVGVILAFIFLTPRSWFRDQPRTPPMLVRNWLAHLEPKWRSSTRSIPKEWPAELIVIGSHGQGGVQRALFGSVADAVMQHTPCPVLVIRASE